LIVETVKQIAATNAIVLGHLASAIAVFKDARVVVVDIEQHVVAWKAAAFIGDMETQG